MRTLLLLMSFIFVIGCARGQDESVPLKKIDAKKWKQVVGETTFEENPLKLPEPEEEEKGWNFSLPGINPELLRAITFALVFALFAFILYYVSRNTTLGKNVKKTKVADGTTPVENIDELDIESLLRDALTVGNLRLAVRVHYLLLLKKLNEAGLITWKKDKTNRDYLSELYGRNACYDDVRTLTLAYELVWYGERAVSSESFQHLNGQFESVNRQITQAQTTS